MSETKPFIRLYLDADVDVKLATNLREAGYDCISTRQVGNEALDDESQMLFAANEGRVLITHNIRPFVPLFERWWRANRHHPSVVVSQQIPLGVLQRRVVNMPDTVTSDGVENNRHNLAEFAERWSGHPHRHDPPSPGHLC